MRIERVVPLLARMSGILSVISVLSAALVLASLPSAQVRTAYPEKRGVKLTEFPRTIKLAENVYGYEEIRQPGFTTVSLFVVGNDGVLLADGQGNAEATKKLLDAIAKVTPKPVKWRSEERRVGKECRSRWARYHQKKKKR